MEASAEGVKPTAVKEGVLTRIRRKAEEVARGFDPRPPEVEFTSVNPQSMAGIILSQIGNPVRERFGGNRWANPFTVDDVFANVRVIPNEEYPTSTHKQVVENKIRDSVKLIAGSGALAIVKLDWENVDSAVTLYRVVDEKKLRDIAEGRLSLSPEPAR